MKLPARAILDLPEMPKCYKATDEHKTKFVSCRFRKLDKKKKDIPVWCGLTGTPLLSSDDLDDKALPDCPFREVPEWTEEDSKFINLWLDNVKCLQEKLGNEEIIALRILSKLCQLAGVEIKR